MQGNRSQSIGVTTVPHCQWLLSASAAWVVDGGPLWPRPAGLHLTRRALRLSSPPIWLGGRHHQRLAAASAGLVTDLGSPVACSEMPLENRPSQPPNHGASDGRKPLGYGSNRQTSGGARAMAKPKQNGKRVAIYLRVCDPARARRWPRHPAHRAEFAGWRRDGAPCHWPSAVKVQLHVLRIEPESGP
jgi:hypothetical protein